MSKSQSSRRRHWIIAAVLLLSATAILAAIPELMRWGAVRALRDLGLSTTIENIDFNPFSGRLRVDGLWAQSGPAPVLSADRLELELHWRALFERRLQINELRLDGTYLLFEQSADGEIRAAGISPPPPTADSSPAAGASEAPWTLRLDRLLWTGGRLEALLPQGRHELRVDRLEVADLDTGVPAQETRLDFRGSINAGQVRLAGLMWPLASPRSAEFDYEVQDLALTPYLPWLPLERLDGDLHLAGQLAMTQSDASLRIDQSGRWQVSQLAVAGSDPGLVQVESLNLDAKVGLTLAGERLQVALDSVVLDLAGIAAATPQIELDLAALQWAGQVSIDRQAELQLDLGGRLLLTELGADLLKPAHRLHVASLAWDGRVDLDGAVGPLPELTGALELAEASLRERNLQLQLLELDALRARDFALHPDATLDLERFELGGLAALRMQGAPTVLRVAQIALDRMSADAETGATIERLDLAGLQVDLSRDESGEFLVLRQLAADAETETETDATGEGAVAAGSLAAATAQDAESAAEPAATASPGLRIGRLMIGDGSGLRFRDAAVDPAFDLALRIDSLQVEALDTRRPEQPLRFALRAASGEHTEFVADGEARPFLAEPAARIKGRITHFELQPLSAYTRTSLGYKLSSGLADADFEIEIGDGAIAGTTRFDLVGLELNPSDEGKMEALTQRLSMPLPSALNLLRQDDGSIELEVPVDGRLDDPQFDVSDAINQALGSAMKSGVFAYLKTMMQPYGTLITLAQMAGEAATRVRLDPVTYPPGSDQADIDLAAYLDRLAGLMRDKPDLTLRLCGFYTAADIEALQPPPAPAPTPAPGAGTASPAMPMPPVSTPTLSPEDKAEALANQRAAGLKRRLVDEFDLAPGRLPLCLPEADRDREAVARVELLI